MAELAALEESNRALIQHIETSPGPRVITEPTREERSGADNLQLCQSSGQAIEVALGSCVNPEEHQGRRQKQVPNNEDDPDILQTFGQKMKTTLTNGPGALPPSLGSMLPTAPEEDTVAQSRVIYSNTPLSGDPSRERRS